MAKKRIYEDHALTGIEKKRRHDDAAVSIDTSLDEALAKIDWNRRREAETDIVKWVQTYCVPLMLNDTPPELGESILRYMYNAINSHSNYMIAMPRGHGKTSYVECVTLFALATGLHKYVVVISNNARAANGIMMDIWRAIAETDTLFSIDYPEVCFPFQVCNGSFRRRQTYRGVSTDIQKNSGNIVFARLRHDDNSEFQTSGSILTCRGVSSGLRGMKFGKLRPTCALLDDLQTSEIAENPEAVHKLMQTIRKDIMPLAGKERLSILQTATPIVPEDLVEQIQNDKAWKTQLFQAIIKYPSNMEMWKRYFQLFDKESIQDLPHTESLEFYKSNKATMDEGSQVFNPSRYSERDGHISAIQKLLEIRHQIGESAFQSEYQMKPKKLSFALDISPKTILQKVGQNNQLVVPDGFIYCVASTDLNVSYAMTTSIVAFRQDMTSTVLYHDIKKVRIDGKLPDIDYNQKLYQALIDLGKKLKQLGIKIDGWGIDAGGRNFSTVCEFAKNSSQLVGIPACAMAGKASHVFNPFMRSRLRDAIGRTILCGDQMEQQKSGAGHKYMFFDSDVYREMVQRAFLSPLGSQGGCQLYDGTPEEHTEFAQQVTNEQIKFVKHRQDGRNEYYWTSKEPHDYLDTMAMCFAIASSQGISGNNIQTGAQKVRVVPKKKRFKIV